MNKFGTVVVIIAISAFVVGVLASVCYAFCTQDWKCMMDCQSMGYTWGYCRSICTYCN